MKHLSRAEMKNVIGGFEPPATSYTCSGPGFGSETYNVTTLAEAAERVIASVVAGQCNVNSISCTPNYTYNA